MSDKEELLDSVGAPQPKKKSKEHYKNRAIIYVASMLVGSLIYVAFLSRPAFGVLIDPFIYTAVAIVLAIPIEAIREYSRHRKNKKKAGEVNDDPLWFHVLESALSLLILLFVLAFLARLLLSR